MSKRTVIIVAGLLAAVAGGVAWFGFDYQRDRRAATGVPAAQRQVIDADRAASSRADSQSDLAAHSAPATSATSQGAADPDDDMDTTLALDGGPVLISYPEGFGLATTQEQLATVTQIPACDQGFDYCVYLDSGEYEGTNFSSAGVRIDVRDDLTSEADCMLTQPDGYSDLVPVVAGASDFATTTFPDIGQGAAGHYSNGSLSRLYYDSVCYEFETRIGQAQYGNFPVGTVEEFDAADMGELEDRLASVLDAVTLPDGRSGLWARKTRSSSDEARP